MQHSSNDRGKDIDDSNADIRKVWKIKTNKQGGADNAQANIRLDVIAEKSKTLHENNVSLDYSLGLPQAEIINSLDQETTENQMLLDPPGRVQDMFLKYGIEEDFVEVGDIIFLCEEKSNGAASAINRTEAFRCLLIPKEPDARDKCDTYTSKIRLIRFGKNQLPTIHKRCFWSFVEKVCENFAKNEEKVEKAIHETGSTKINRIIGKGTYVMKKCDESPTMIQYTLKSPLVIIAEQIARNIKQEDSFCLLVKSFTKTNTLGIGLPESQKAVFPNTIKRKFGTYNFLPAESDMLDVVGCEAIWILASCNDFEALLCEFGSQIEAADNEIITNEIL